MCLHLAVGDLSALEELAGDAADVVVVTGDGGAVEYLALVNIAFRELACNAAELLAGCCHVTLDGAAGDVCLGCAADDSAHCGDHRDALEVAVLLVVDEALDGAVGDLAALHQAYDAAACAQDELDLRVDGDVAEGGILSVAGNHTLLAVGSVVCVSVDLDVGDLGSGHISEHTRRLV